MKYLSLTHIEFIVDFDAEWAPDSLLGKLRHQLLRTGYAESRADALLEPLRSRSQRRRVGGGDFRMKLLETAAQLLLERVYDTVPQMRYQMLKNELDYATTKKCRRIVIRSIFDDEEYIPTDDYKCGFCDVCEPKLEFKVQQAAVPLRDAQVEDIARMLPDLLGSFETDTLSYVVTTAVNRGAVSGLYARVSNRLERDSTNLSALYLSGTLARRRPGRQREALQFLKRGFHEGTVQGRSTQDLLVFADEASHVDRHEGFDLLTPVEGPFNTDEGLGIVQAQANKLFGEAAEETRTIKAVRKTKKLATTATKVMETLQEPVQDLLAGFAELDDLFKMDAAS